MFKGWIERLPPDALDQHPRLNSYYLFTSIFSGMPADEVIHQLEVLSELDQENNIQGDILALQALIAVYNGDIHHSAELAEKALNTLPEESIFFRSTIAGFLGFAYMVYGNIQSARRTLEESARVSSQAGNLTMHVLALCHLAEIALLEARIADAEIYYRQVLDMGLDAKGKPRPIVGMALIGLGTLQRERGQLEDAFETLSQGVELVQMWAPSGAVQGYVNLAWIHQLQGDEAAADSALATAAKLALRFQPMEEDDKYVRCHQARMQITRRNPLQALHILSVSPQTTLADLDQAFPALAPERSHSFADLISYIITSSAYFTLEKYDIAERLLSRVRKATQAKGWKRLEMTIMTSLAEIYARCGRKDMALQTLSQPLELAAQEGYVTEFLERGPRLADLLRQALHAGIEPEYVALLLTHIEASDKGVQPASPVERASLVLVEPLSEREFEVLALVAEGYTNAEIGTLLVLSTFTVKKHVSNILGKLGVPSRKLAAERGRELGLI
jgi:LuxR family maltose regulon positive regulatory protein